MNTQVLATLKQARVDMLMKLPFFGALAIRLKLEASDQLPAPMGTDGETIWYNPAQLDQLKWTYGEMVAVLCHEVLHCVFAHQLRRKHRDPMLWNLAADAVINPIINDMAHILQHKGKQEAIKLPKDTVNIPKYKGWSTERVYEDMQQNTQSNSNSKGNGEGKDGKGQPQPWNCGGVQDAKAGTATEQAQDWTHAVRQAAQHAKSRGSLPSGLESLIEELLEPKLDWRSLLREFIETHVDRTDYHWTRPNPRYVGYGYYLPSLYGKATPALAVYVDTSGSTNTKEQRTAFASEMQAIAQETRPQRLYVVHNDAAVHKVQTFEQGDDVVINAFYGNGGTDFRPPFKWADDEGVAKEIACAVFFTDMEGPFPQDPPDYPVLWISTSKQLKAPWGQTVYLEAET